MVVVFHSFPVSLNWGAYWQVSPGIVGVRLFFVLSGCLISSLLWTLQDEGRAFGVTWRRFAYRRALRIFPLAYVAMGMCWLAGVPAMVEQPWFHLTFTNNLAEMAYGASWPDGLPHFWTLAIEEQIYLVWPVLLLLTPCSRWPLVAISLIVSACAVRIALEPTLWYSPIYVVDAFAAGSLIAWSARQHQLDRVVPLVGCVGLCLVAVAWIWPGMIGSSSFETGLVLITAAVVGWAWQRPTQRVLSWGPLVWLGTLSYGVYVWHEAGPRMLYALGLPYLTEGWDVLALKLSCGIGLAALTWYGFERPINRLKDRETSEQKFFPKIEKLAVR